MIILNPLGPRRDLHLDASQISLGDAVELTLVLDTGTPTQRLRDVLKASFVVQLDFNLLGDGQGPVSYRFHYRLEDGDLTCTYVSSQPPTNTKGFFGRLRTQRSTALDATASHLELVWRAEAWDTPGTFAIAGAVNPRAATQPKGKGGADIPEGEVEVLEDLEAPAELDFSTLKLRVQEPEPVVPVRVTLTEAGRQETYDQALWSLIRHRSLSFSRYRSFIDSVLCSTDAATASARQAISQVRPVPFSRLASYSLLKVATEYFLMQETGLALGSDLDYDAGSGAVVVPDLDDQNRMGGAALGYRALRDDYLEQLEKDEGKALPYFRVIRQKLAEVKLKGPADLPWGGDTPCYGILKSRLQAPPLLELIWSYWHEEGGLVQTMNAISLRFQNVRRPGRGPDPLAGLNLDPLRPMSNLIWGYIEDERNRLTLNRRNLEYQYEYGFGLLGRGVQPIAPAEHRTFFLRGFHGLLRACAEFYQQANFTTVIPDGFPLLNCLREVHMTLAEGAHNQYGDLPWTARAEMLSQQWLLARPEVREFLGGRVMVPYAEPWMDRVDTMKTLQAWNPTNVSHFHDLGTFGEQLLLSIRYGAWNSPSVGAANAANWAHYWREEIQRYLHAYKAVTGVDLATDLGDVRQNLPDNPERYLQPAQLIERQTALQRSQLRASRQLGAGLGPLRQPAFGALSGRRALEE